MNIPSFKLVGKRMNVASKESFERHSRTLYRAMKRMLRDDADIQNRWDSRKRKRLQDNVKDFGCQDASKKI